TRLHVGAGAHAPAGLADPARAAGGQRHAVAGAAHAVASLAGEHGPDADGLHLTAGLHERLELVGPDHRASPQLLAVVGLDDLPIDLHVVGQHPTVHPGTQVADHIAPLVDDLDDDAAIGLAVVLDHDDLLGDVDQPAGEVTRVGRSQGGGGQPLAGTVRR